MASDRPDRLPGRWRDAAGNTLLLFPAAILVILGLGGMALDAATLFLSQRRLVDLATAVAGDAVAAVDHASYYGHGTVAIDRDRALSRRTQLLAGVEEDWSLHDIRCAVDIDGDRATATCTGQVRPLLAPLWWSNGTRTREVSATETARGAQR